MVLLALLVATAPPANTQAAEIGGGIEIQPANGPNGAYAQVGPSGQVSIQLDGDAAVPGEGLQADTLTRFDRVLLVINTNSADGGEGRQAYIHVVAEGTSASDFNFYSGNNPETSIEGEDNAVRLDTGESTSVGFTVDTRGDFEATDLALTVVAEVSEIADAILVVEGDIPTAGDPVTFDATESNGDALVYTYDFGDGTTAADAGPRTQHTFDELGTYNVTLTVDETTSEVPEGSDTVTKEVILRGNQQAGDTEEVIEIPDPVPGGPEPALQSVSATPDGATASDVLVRAVAAESVSDITGTPPGGSATIAGGSINPVDATNANSIVTLTVAESALPAGTEPDELAIERYNGASWEVLPTAVEDTSGDTVTLAAATPGFSLFAVTVNDAPALDNGDGPDTAPNGGGGGGGGGVDSATETEDVVDVETTTTETATIETTDSGTQTQDAGDITEGEDTTVSTEAETAESGGAAVTPSTDQTTDREPSGFGPVPTLGVVVLVALLLIVVIIRIRQKE